MGAVAEVAFHFNVPDRTAYTCRLLRKVWRAGHRAHVVLDAADIHALDTALWVFAADEFVPHATQHAAPHVRERSPIVLADEQTPVPSGAVLVNLLPHIPQVVAQGGAFARVIEIVSLDERDRAPARERWRWYASQGHPLVRHDLAAAGGVA